MNVKEVGREDENLDREDMMIDGKGDSFVVC